MKKVTEKAEELSQNESVAGEKRFLFNLNREKIEKMILYTAMILALNHIFVAIWVAIYNIGVPSIRSLDDYLTGALVAEILLLLLYLKKNDNECRKSINVILKRYFTKDQILLGILPFLYIVSFAVNTALDGVVRHEENFRYIFDMFLNVFVFYPIGRYFVKKKLPKVFEIIVHILILGITCYIVYILFNVFNGVTITTFFRGKIGMTYIDFSDHVEYHLQINSHHNTSGAFAASFMLISLCMTVWKRGILRILYLLSAFVHCVTLILTNSRSTFISGCSFVAILIGIMFFYMIKHKVVGKKILRWLVTVIVVIATFLLLCSLRKTVFAVCEKCTNIRIENKNDMELSQSSIADDQTSENGTMARDLAITNLLGREKIWSSAITGTIMNNRNLFFGVTPAGVPSLVADMSKGEYFVYTHNEIIEMGTALGLPALLVFIVWLILLANRCVIIGFAEENKLGLGEKLVPMLVLFLVMFNMMEAILFWYNTFIGGFFMLVSGWCYEAVRSCRVANTKRVFGYFATHKYDDASEKDMQQNGSSDTMENIK